MTGWTREGAPGSTSSGLATLERRSGPYPSGARCGAPTRRAGTPDGYVHHVSRDPLKTYRHERPTSRTAGPVAPPDRLSAGKGDIHRMDAQPHGVEPPPFSIPPMMAVLRDELPPDDGRWAYEMKWDGVRAVVHVNGGRHRIMSRNDNDMTAAYPELREMAESLGALQVVLDGEIVALDSHGTPSFSALQPRMHVTDAAQVRRLQKSTPVTFLAFDVLHLDGHSTLELPYDDRRRLLESLELEGPSWRTPPAWYSDGQSVLEAAAEQGLEGIVTKRRDSTYRPGRRSDTWVKVKHLRTQEVVIGGWKPGAGRRGGVLGSLLLGIPGAAGLEYVGKVGTGFTDEALAELTRRLMTLERADSPFAGRVPSVDARDARWVEPRIVGEVRFGEWTRDGRLRHPAWRGIRIDKRPSDVVRES